MKYVLAMLGAITGMCACHGVRPGSRPEECDPFHNGSSAAKVPSFTAATAAGRVTLVGYVADATTGRGLRNSLVVLSSGVPGSQDSTAVYPDSTGAFTLSDLRPGRYGYSVRSVNFRAWRGSIDLGPGIDTLRALLARGAPICKVTL